MAKVQIDDEFVDIQVSWLDRMELRQRPRRVPLRHIRAALPRNLPSYSGSDRGVWTHDLGSTQREAALRSTPLKSHWISIELRDEEEERLWVDVEDESPELIAARIERAVRKAEAREGAPQSAHASGIRMKPLPAPALQENDSRHLTRLGAGLIVLGMLCIMGGSLLLLLGVLSGVLGLGAGLISGMLGTCAWVVGLVRE